MMKEEDKKQGSDEVSIKNSMPSYDEGRVLKICKDHGLSVDTVCDVIFYRAQGLNNRVIGDTIGVHRLTVQRYCSVFRDMSDEDFDYLFLFAVFSKVLESSGNLYAMSGSVE